MHARAFDLFILNKIKNNIFYPLKHRKIETDWWNCF